MDKFRGLDTDEGWIRRELADLKTQVQELSAARRLVVASASVQVDTTVTLTGTFDVYASTPVTVPAGYTRALVQSFVSAGTTIDGDLSVMYNGVIGVVGVIDGVNGGAISQGRPGGGPVTVSAAFNRKITVTPGSTFNVALRAYYQGTARVAGSDNVHLSALVLFTRG